MGQYLEIAKGIHSWLENLQIKQQAIEAELSDGKYCFCLLHPTKGEVEVEAEFSGDKICIVQGIALRLRSGNEVTARVEVYDAGGIFDPIDGRVQGEHYSTSHFALLGSILYCETREQRYLESAKLAVEFHLRTSPTEYQPMSEWMYHWDFQNYAFALTFRLLRGHLSADELARWTHALKSWKTNDKNKLTNWAAMRAWAFAERSDLFGGLLDPLKIRHNLRYVKRARSSDGCFDDNFGLSRPIQYHIFTVAILHRLHLVRENADMRQWFLDGVHYFLPFIDPDGDFNYLGRGHEQIFGYGAAIYALEAAYKETGEDHYLALARKLLDYLLGFKKDGHFPLVLNDRPDEERSGWYDYHHLTVYNAFLGVWLGLAHLLANSEGIAEETQPQMIKWASKPTQVAIVSNENYYVAFCGGLPEYLSEPGITPQHLWWRNLGFIFSCPGGPTPDRFGERSPGGSELNLFAPIAKNCTDWHVPAHGRCHQFELEDDRLRMRFDYGPFVVKRTVFLGKDDLRFEDEFRFQRPEMYEDFRFFNFPVAKRFDVAIFAAERLTLSAGGDRLVVEFEDDDLQLEQAELIDSAKGKMQTVVKRILNFKPESGEQRMLKWRITAEPGERR